MNKTKINYWVDLVIALAFVLSAISGIIFLFPPGNATALGVSYRVWDQIHVWGSLLMIAGVLAHLVLHWKWIVAMTKKTFLPAAKPARARTATEETLAGRRQFMRTAGMSAVALGAVAIGYRSLFGSESAQAGQLAADAGVTQSTTTSIPATEVTIPSTATPQAVQSAATSVPAAEAAAPVTSVSQPVTLPTTTPTAAPTTVSTIELTTQNIAAPQPTVQTGQTMTVACHKGITYDAYPGKCRHYVDRDGDGYCDYSIPTAA